MPLARGKTFRRVRERGPQFQPDVLESPDNTLLIGYWQSEKYFMDEEAQIRRDFAFVSPLSSEKEAVARTIANNSFLPVHIRRGDYVSALRRTSFTASFLSSTTSKRPR